MDFEAIDKIIQLIKNNDWEYIINNFEKCRLNRIESKSIYWRKFLKKLVNKIDDDCFETIYNNIKSNNYSSNKLIILTNILVYMSDERKKCV